MISGMFSESMKDFFTRNVVLLQRFYVFDPAPIERKKRGLENDAHTSSFREVVAGQSGDWPAQGG